MTGVQTCALPIYGNCYRTGNYYEYVFKYYPTSDFSTKQTVNIKIDAKDLNANTMSQYSYSFSIVDNYAELNISADCYIRDSANEKYGFGQDQKLLVGIDSSDRKSVV